MKYSSREKKGVALKKKIPTSEHCKTSEISRDGFALFKTIKQKKHVNHTVRIHTNFCKENWSDGILCVIKAVVEEDLV